MNSSVKYGVILGLVNSVLSGILYAMGLEVMMSPLAYIQIVVSIGLFVYFGIQCRKENGGYFTFGEAFKTIIRNGGNCKRYRFRI